MSSRKGMVDEMLAETVKPLIPSWSVISVDDYCNAIGLLASLEGGVVVGDLRIAITVTPYTDDDEYDH